MPDASRPAAGVLPEQAQELRVRLGAAGLLDMGASPHRDAGRVWFPLVDGATVAAIREAAPGLEDIQVEARPFQLRERRPAHYTELLQDLPEEVRVLLPMSYDVVGQILLIKLPEPLLPYRGRIGKALLEVHVNAETVALDRGVTGELRVRDLEVIAGPPRLTTIHKEHGLEITVALDKVYFSPRLATERQRLVDRIHDGERVLDLFAGVGAFLCLVARERELAAATAIDLNEDAVELLRKNLERNRIALAVDVRMGDARQVAPRTKDWDHVVMNLPHGAIDFLDVAADCVAPDGEVHLYAMVERSEHDEFVAHLQERMTGLTDQPWKVVAERHVRNYAPTMDGLSFTLRAAPTE